MLESFVVQELRKQVSWARGAATLHHFREASGREVDAVLEAPGGKVVGIEVKASASAGRSDFLGLAALADAAGKRFVRGVVFYLGDQPVTFGDRFWAMPIGELWRGEVL